MPSSFDISVGSRLWRRFLSDPPTAGDCRSGPQRGSRLHRAKPPVDPLAACQSAIGHCALSHRGTGRSSRRVHPLCSSCPDFLQQLPQPSLPKVSDQTAARERWIAARRRELLPTRYLHVVFTLPRHLAPLVLHNKKVLYDLLFRTSAETLLEVARDPRHLGAEIGFFSVLHTCLLRAYGPRNLMKIGSS